ncbi:hypothetical protein [Paenibacillus sp. 2TAB19]|uniref:hypothetical protein n=1 Tax=Paenibacillus sp. 2TAB19 TaxID=3233003 RepID=UPI003F952812
MNTTTLSETTTNRKSKHKGDHMAIWDYQLILFPIGNISELTDDGMDFIGPHTFSFHSAITVIRTIDFVKNYSPENKWPSFDDACYYCFNDEQSIVEIEINSGIHEEEAEIISIRTNIYRDEGNIEKAIEICKKLCKELNLLIWDMKMKRQIEKLKMNQVLKLQ